MDRIPPCLSFVICEMEVPHLSDSAYLIVLRGGLNELTHVKFLRYHIVSTPISVSCYCFFLLSILLAVSRSPPEPGLSYVELNGSLD